MLRTGCDIPCIMHQKKYYTDAVVFCCDVIVYCTVVVVNHIDGAVICLQQCAGLCHQVQGRIPMLPIGYPMLRLTVMTTGLPSAISVLMRAFSDMNVVRL